MVLDILTSHVEEFVIKVIVVKPVIVKQQGYRIKIDYNMTIHEVSISIS